MNQVAASNNS